MVLLIVLQLLLAAVAFHAPLMSFAGSVGPSVQLCRKDERQALLAFKMGFTINVSSSGGCQSAYAKTESWKNGSDCCEWDGVTCNPLTGHVIELDLSCSLLGGSLPSNSTLFLLRRLNLSHNSFSSPIPPGFGQLSDLTFLDLSYSGLSGQVPRDIGWLSRLTTLDLSGNELLSMANFKTIIANLTDLRKLDLTGVSITSNLPPTIANLSKLAYLGLSGCGLQGEFPATSVLSLPELRVLLLGGNGGIHADFSAVQWRSPLEVVDLSECTLFTGKLPKSIGDSSNSSLRSFNIVGCQFYGDIPGWIWTVAEEIDISGTRLSGSLPPNVNTTRLVGLYSISMGDNMLTGMIPGWLFTLPFLESLSLEENLFTGIGQLETTNGSTSSSLEEFWADNNRLQGQIPEVIFELHNLQLLDLERNNLTGTIPFSKFLNLHNLNSLFLSHNNLSIIDDTSANSNSSWPSFDSLGLSSCNLGHFPSFLRKQVNLGMLELSNNGIHGVVPEWLLDIGSTSLTILDLSYNSLTGGLEHLPWQNMVQIDIRYNMLQGALPVPSPTITYFWASNNRFSGGIPPSLCNTDRLALLDLSLNNLMGNIPDCLAYPISQQLLILDLRQNQLQGEIPSFSFEECPWLFTLSLSGNRLEGPIPQSLNNCLMLQLLDLGSNNLNGTFPRWLNVLPDLEVLILGSNHLQGSLMGSNTTKPFQKLRILDISNNDLTGGLPGGLLMSMKAMVEVNNSHSWPYMGLAYYQDSIMAWVKGKGRQLDAILDTLVLIDASRNRLDGPIPETIGDLVSLRWLNLAHNNFTGNIPPSMGNLTLLESLDLSFNRLDGHIPSELVNLNSLELFNVSENNLVGPVPTAKQFGTFLDSSYLGNPGLCGDLLTKKCEIKNKPQNSTSAEGSGSESSGFHLWAIVLMGYGCGMFVGFVWGFLIFWERTPKWVGRLIFEIEVFIMLHQRRRRQNRRN